MSSLIRRFIVDESGQDLIEYALITVFVGIAGFAAIELWRTSIGTTYASWMDVDSGPNSLWETPDPLPPAP
jgi:Flp pilus assembly pilin Flp